MSRSLGGTSLTIWSPIYMSPEVTSSSPAIMRKVVLLPQPEGPTKTTNSRSAMSRSIPCTAGVRSNVLTMLRSATCAILLSFRGAGGQAGDVIVHQKRVDDQRWSRAEQSPRHDLSPRVHVSPDQGGDDADRQGQLIGRGGKCEGIKEVRPRHGEAENGCRDDPWERYRDKNPCQHLDIAGAIDQRRLVEFLRDAGEIADHDPGAKRHCEGRQEDDQHPPMIDKLDPGLVMDKGKSLEQRDEKQRVRDQIGQEHTGRQGRRSPELHASQ